MDKVVDGWLVSLGYCVNLMNFGYCELGVVYVIDLKSDVGIYWMVMFGLF